MKRISTLIVLMLMMGLGRSWGQVTLPHYDGINYTAGQALQTQAGWTVLNSGDDLLIAAGSLTYPGFPGSAGNKVTFDGAGIDAAKLFTQQTSGTGYFSFLVNISALGSLGTTGGYFTAFNEGTGTNFGATVWLRSDGAGYDIGINPRTTAANTVWSSGTTAINGTHLIVISYQIVSGTGNDVVKMWIDPALGGAEPAATLSATNTGGTDLANLNRIIVRQDNATNTPFVQMDELRIGTTWASVTPAAPTTQASNITFSNIQTGQFDFNWTDGNGTSRAVFAAAATSGTASPISNTTYTANTTFGSGTQIGTTGWYCVYNGSAAHPTDITINGLATNTAYRLMVVEYNGAAGAESYNISTATNNPNNQTTSAGASPSYVINSNLSAFSTTLGTPSSQQSYTISGANLTPSSTVSITAPAEFEVSLTSGSFTGTNGNTVNLSTTAGGTINGEPVSIYVRYNPAAAGNHSGNIAHIGAGVSPAVNLAVTGSSSAYFYSKASGDLTTPATFNTATDGSGIDAVNFTGANQTFEIYNRPSATITSDWTVSGSGSKIVVGTGSDFTIPSTNSVTGTIDVASGRQLILNNTILPTLGSLGTGSTVEYAQSSATTIKNLTADAVTYSNLKLSGTGTKSFKPNTTTVTGNLIYDGQTNGALTIEGGGTPFTTVNLTGDLTFLGTVTGTTDANAYTLVATGAGTQTITGSGNTVRLFRLTVNNAGSNILLSTSGGSTNLLVGNGSGGGITLTNATSTLALNGNTLTFFAGKPTIIGAGTFTGSASSNIVINKTDAVALGTLSFTSGARVLNNLTLNHTGASAATATLGTPLDINGTLTLTAGALLLNGNTLTLNGPVSYGTGTLTGSATSNLVIGGTAQNQSLNFTQTSAATRSLNNLTLNALSSATLGSALDLYGVLSLTAVSTLDANSQNLTLKSTATGTARVANLTGSFLTNAGNVTVERYIADPGHRAWHLLSAKAVTGSQTIFDSWQESGAVVANKGTWLTSGSTLLPGFDGTSQNGASILIHDQTVPSWTTIPVANTDATALSSRQGYMLFVRGDRSCTPANATITPTVLKANGTLTQGTLAPVTVSATGTGRTLVGNPYASPIDIDPILTGTSNLDQNVYIWDPTATGNYGVGAFAVVERDGGGNYSITPFGGSATADANSRYMHSGQAFFLKASTADASVVFSESMKVASVSAVNPIVNTQSREAQLYANLMIVNPGNAVSLADGIRVRFNDNYSPSTQDDILKMGNFAENIASFRDNKKLIVEKRPPVTGNDTVFLRMSNTAVRDYQLQLGALNFAQAGVAAFVEDTYTGKRTALDMSGNVNKIDFSITTEAGSANPDRFRIVFSAMGAVPVTTAAASLQGNSIAVSWNVSNQLNMKEYTVERSADGNSFSKLTTVPASSADGANAGYSWLDLSPNTGDNYYRIVSVNNYGASRTSNVVNVKMLKEQPAITVYPNPATGHVVGLRFKNMEAGTYQVKLFNNTGQSVLVIQLNHTGGDAVQNLGLPKTITAGFYQLEIIKPDRSKMMTNLLITK